MGRAMVLVVIYLAVVCCWVGVGLFIAMAPRRFGNLVNESYGLFPEVGPRDWGKALFLRLVGIGLLAFAARFIRKLLHIAF